MLLVKELSEPVNVWITFWPVTNPWSAILIVFGMPVDEVADVILKTKKTYIININSTVQPGTIESEIIPFLEKGLLKNS